MPTIAHTVHREELSLDNLHPMIGAQVRDLFTRVAAAFQDESELLDRESRKARITLKIDLEHTLETRTTTLTATVEGKLPGYRGVVNVVRLPHGGDRFLVEVDDSEQIDLDRPVGDDEGGVQ